MPGTAIPAAITALVAAARDLDGYGAPGRGLPRKAIPVFDGADLTDTDAKRALVIGTSTVDDGSRLADAGLVDFLDSRDDQFDIVCAALAWAGDGDAIPELRGEVFAMVADVDAMLAADRQLGGVVIDARLSRVSYRVQQRDELLVASDFRVRISAG